MLQKKNEIDLEWRAETIEINGQVVERLGKEKSIGSCNNYVLKMKADGRQQRLLFGRAQ